MLFRHEPLKPGATCKVTVKVQAPRDPFSWGSPPHSRAKCGANLVSLNRSSKLKGWDVTVRVSF